MHPEPDKRFAGCAFGLRDLILVMREDQVDAAAMDVKRLTEILHRHRRALEVPAWPAFTKRRRPAGLSILFRGLPQNEIARIILFVLIDVDARASDVAF